MLAIESDEMSEIRLTPFGMADATVMCDADRDPEIRRRFEFPDDFVPSLIHSQRVIERWHRERAARTRFTLAVRDEHTSELLGGCEYKPLGDGVANVSYWTYPRHRDRGIAKRALAMLCDIAINDFHTLEALIDPDNIASQAVARANAFTEAGKRDNQLLYVRHSRVGRPRG